MAAAEAFVADKVHRNLAEFLVDAGHLVIAPPTSVADAAPPYSHIFSLKSFVIGDRMTIDASLRSGDGTNIAIAEITGRPAELRDLYKVIPAALMYGLNVSEVSLRKKDIAKRPTNDNLAYAYYLNSWRQMQANNSEGGERSLLRAVQLDARFAMGYWALAELKRRGGAIPRQMHIFSGQGKSTLITDRLHLSRLLCRRILLGL